MEGAVVETSQTEVDLLRAELAELRKEVASMRTRPVDEKATEASDGPTATEASASNRRGFLRLAGAAAVGATAVAVAGSAQPAAAATGGFLVIGGDNNPTNPNDSTRLFNPGTGALGDQTLLVQNYTTGTAPVPPADHRVAVAGLVSGVDTSSATSIRTGVYGRTASPGALGGQGVFGSSEGVENTFASNGFSFGVVGTATTSGYGVFGYTPTGAASIGVLGRSDEGYGVIASSFTGVSLYARNGGRILQDLRTTNGAPTTGSFIKGELIRDLAGDAYICVTSGTPGTWRKLVAQHPDFANSGGSLNLLASPIRIVDTRGNGAPVTNGTPSAKLAPGTPLVAQITGTVVTGISVPAGATGILGNITATETSGNGFAVVWAGGPQPGTSNINYSLVTGSPAIANYFISAISTDGKLSIATAASSTHILIDVFGFVF